MISKPKAKSYEQGEEEDLLSRSTSSRSIELEPRHSSFFANPDDYKEFCLNLPPIDKDYEVNAKRNLTQQLPTKIILDANDDFEKDRKMVRRLLNDPKTMSQVIKRAELQVSISCLKYYLESIDEAYIHLLTAINLTLKNLAIFSKDHFTSLRDLYVKLSQESSPQNNSNSNQKIIIHFLKTLCKSTEEQQKDMAIKINEEYKNRLFRSISCELTQIIVKYVWLNSVNSNRKKEVLKTTADAFPRIAQRGKVAAGITAGGALIYAGIKISEKVVSTKGNYTGMLGATKAVGSTVTFSGISAVWPIALIVCGSLIVVGTGVAIYRKWMKKQKKRRFDQLIEEAYERAAQGHCEFLKALMRQEGQETPFLKLTSAADEINPKLMIKTLHELGYKPQQIVHLMTMIGFSMMASGIENQLDTSLDSNDLISRAKTIFQTLSGEQKNPNSLLKKDTTFMLELPSLEVLYRLNEIAIFTFYLNFQEDRYQHYQRELRNLKDEMNRGSRYDELRGHLERIEQLLGMMDIEQTDFLMMIGEDEIRNICIRDLVSLNSTVISIQSAIDAYPV